MFIAKYLEQLSTKENPMVNNNRAFLVKLKSIVVLFLSALIIASCSSIKQNENTQNQTFNQTKVMTFNIRYGSADDGENSWPNRKNILFDVIRDFNPDLLGMQEVLKFQLDELLEQMPSYSFAGVGRDDGKTAGEYSPIFFSKDRYILDTTNTFWMSDTPQIPGSKNWGNNFTRICTWVKLFDKFTGKSFYYLNTHLDHQSPESRVKSAQAIVNTIKGFKEKLPVILSGDFNTGENEETIKIIKSSGLVDTYRFLHSKSDSEGTFNSFKGEDTKDKIDFIFTSNDFKCVNSQIIKTNRNGRYPSDHFPVTAALELLNE